MVPQPAGVRKWISPRWGIVLQGVQEQAAAQVQQLTAADTKLTAAIVAALLSTPGHS
ncbi:MAG TPA: hypothetical protein VNZ53_14545 [Steroidobacteraceae bacterium]|jgi:hypothetical protein|nr:hypothetical protein [Steroidobacteraceae bacterium]